MTRTTAITEDALERRRAYLRERARRARRAAGVPERQMYPELRDRDWLIQRHLREFLSTKEIADILGCSPDTVRKYLRLAGLDVVHPGVRTTLRDARRKREEASE